MTGLIKKIGFYSKYSFKFFILKKDIPLILGLVITDRCNLSCKGCRVANTGRPSLTMDETRDKLNSYHRKGFRELYIEGGEPFLWGNNGHTLDDVVDFAKKTGYFHVHIYTNGTIPLKSNADILWVSLDGLEGTYRRLCGDHFNKVVNNIRSSDYSNIGLIYVINSVNKNEIKEFLLFVHKSKLSQLGVMFYFHTPYYGKDRLYIESEERIAIINRIIKYKKSGLPVFNSLGGLEDLKTGNWKRPSRMFAITDMEGDYVCCRYNDKEICKDCGYGACTEISAAKKLKPSAIINLMSFW